MQTALWPLVVYFLVVVGLVGLILILSHILGPRHMDRATGEPFESGIKATGTPFIRFDVQYYLVAMFFVVFDLEVVFLVTWAVAVRENGWSGYIEMLVFSAILVAGLAYLWKLGALDWAPVGRRRRARLELTGRGPLDNAGR